MQTDKLQGSLKLYFTLLIIEGILVILSGLLGTDNAFIGIISLIISILSIALLIWSIVVIRKIFVHKLTPKKVLLVLPVAILISTVIAFCLGVYSEVLSQQGLQGGIIMQGSILVFLKYFAQLFSIFQIIFAGFVLNKIKKS